MSTLEELQEEIKRLKSWGVPEGYRMCALCGRTKPCMPQDDPYFPCTMDPTYLELIELLKIERRRK